MKGNPFSLDFGATPYTVIPRYIEANKITGAFTAEIPTTHIFMVMGARGNGKTVLMSMVKEELLKGDEWIHIDLSPESDMMNVLAAGLYQKAKKKLPKWKIDVSIDLKFASAGASAESEEKYSSVYTDLDSMLEHLRERKMKVLITVDEVINSKIVREFTMYFQHCLRERYPVYLLMTGLYKNIRALQNDRSQTFLKRAPRVILGSLSLGRVAQKYKEIFSLTDEAAAEMADRTGGYSYAFQILGYLVYESGKNELTARILKEYEMMLAESSYDKIWEELSANERMVARATAEAPENAAVKTIREALGMDSNEFSTYSDTLEKSGIFASDTAYGRIRFALPYIKEFILLQK